MHLTGCDFTEDFYNKRKVRPFKIFSKSKIYQKIFASLTNEADIFINEKTNVAQEFTDLMYGIKNSTSAK